MRFFRGSQAVGFPVFLMGRRGFRSEDFGRFNLWRPTVVDRTGGSNRLSALPTGSRWNRALPGAEFGNSNVWFPNSSIECAAASGAGHCPVLSLDDRGGGGDGGDVGDGEQDASAAHGLKAGLRAA